jgi:uncharacterized protein
MRTALFLIAFAALSAVAGAARPALVDAAKNGDREALRALVQKKADVNAADADGTTALHWASHRDDLDSAMLLIRAGANVNAANDLGATPLWIASQNRSGAFVKALLQAGANPNLALLLGETPLMVASRSGSADVVEQLLLKGAKVNARADGADVGSGTATRGRRQGAAGEGRRRARPLRGVEPGDGGAAARRARL